MLCQLENWTFIAHSETNASGVGNRHQTSRKSLVDTFKPTDDKGHLTSLFTGVTPHVEAKSANEWNISKHSHMSWPDHSTVPQGSKLAHLINKETVAVNGTHENRWQCCDQVIPQIQNGWALTTMISNTSLWESVDYKCVCSVCSVCGVCSCGYNSDCSLCSVDYKSDCKSW